MDSFTPVFIILLLIAVNGMFVAAEFALVGAPRARIEHLAQRGHRVARLIQQLLHDPRRQDHYIATAQIGITLASLGLGMYGEHVVADWLAAALTGLGASRWVAAHALASVLAIAVLTYFHIVLGEMVPKSLALQHPDRTALWVTPLMLWVKRAFYPVVFALNGLGNGILWLMRVRRQPTSSHLHTAEELQYVVRESEAGGLLRPEVGGVLHELFAFGERTAGEAMVPRVHVVGLPLGAPAEVLRETVRAASHTRYPVYHGDLDHLVGLVHTKDVLRLLLAGRAVDRDVLHPLAYVPEASPLDVVLERMREARTQMAVVMDEHGGTAGLVTIEDLFEEVVGEVEEEAPQHPAIFRDEHEQLHVLGTVRLDELADYLHVPLEHEEVDTVSGLVLALLARPPSVGDVVTYRHVRFEVVAVHEHGVEACIVTPLARPGASDPAPVR